ncbi:hypothetical protein TcCL_ESM06685 [Trypanosoma cruzi]|uniref:PH domain-containing protein n=1 Tax=Trypanosoma cruzi (strain CL Brener) TaxID=353153 RepID=Q4DN05_TRYCC|nr:hypothetical protein Tc00.1047053506203.100 [Trypanosoma cruzi]EAN93913.1 hypothetical protein Tc00.1047053506203.100 [Trypanosoma cruzi]RNC55794.1 hypothetical protein TcCL_ESM06685 [Trypanosoma cruzi]|eukprot:XP_815764.1 hypothetical protein [Trypanosoma cruzi strain CL Brener]
MHPDPVQQSGDAERVFTPFGTLAGRKKDETGSLRRRPPEELSSDSDFMRRQSTMEGKMPIADTALALDSIKREVESSVEFSSSSQNQRWEEAWLGNLSLSSFLRRWGNAVVHEGAGYQLSNCGSVLRRWVRRHFVMAGALLYIFDGDGSTEKCHGAIFLHRADVQKKFVSGHNSIVITPVTSQTSSELGVVEFPSLTMFLDAKQMLDVWFVALQRTSAAPPFPGSATPQRAKASCGYLNAIKCTQTEQQQQVGSAASMPDVVSRAEDAVLSPPSLFPDSALAGVTSIESKAKKEGKERGVEENPRQEQQSRRTSTVINDGPTGNEDREAIIEAYLQQIQHTTVSASILKTRLQRLAEKKDKQQLGELLLQFILNRVNDAADLWSLMDEVETLSDKMPQTSATSTAKYPSYCWVKEPLVLSGTPPGRVACEMAAITSAACSMTSDPIEQRVSSIKKCEAEKKEERVDKMNMKNTQADALLPHAASAAWRQRRRRLHDRRGVIDSILSELSNIS